MKNLTLILIFCLALIAMAAEKASVKQLFMDAAKWDKKIVTTKGVVSGFTARKSRAGNEYFNFKIEDESEVVSVYGRGKLDPAPQSGDTVSVVGVFAKEKTVGTRVFKKEVDVSVLKDDKTTKNFGVKIIKKKVQ